jgi:GT2 family glycosyltransferase
VSRQSKARRKLAVLVTCHNRIAVSEQTLPKLDECLRSLPAIDSTIFVVDDGSSDGTGARLKALLPDIVLEYGSGDLFWNGGMCRAYEIARQRGSFDAYLLFNDDVFVDCGAVRSSLDHYLRLNDKRPAILAASTQSHGSEAISYSAFRRLSRLRPLSVERVHPDGTLQPCDSFNGNFVLVPGPFFEQIGGLDRRFRHGYGDIDLGYVARNHGVVSYLAPMPIGRCDGHTPTSKSQPRSPALRWLMHPWGKGDSLHQRALFIRKHSLAFAVPFLIGGVAVRRCAFKIGERIKRAFAEG